MTKLDKKWNGMLQNLNFFLHLYLYFLCPFHLPLFSLVCSFVFFTFVSLKCLITLLMCPVLSFSLESLCAPPLIIPSVPLALSCPPTSLPFGPLLLPFPFYTLPLFFSLFPLLHIAPILIQTPFPLCPSLSSIPLFHFVPLLFHPFPHCPSFYPLPLFHIAPLFIPSLFSTMPPLFIPLQIFTLSLFSSPFFSTLLLFFSPYPFPLFFSSPPYQLCLLHTSLCPPPVRCLSICVMCFTCFPMFISGDPVSCGFID